MTHLFQRNRLNLILLKANERQFKATSPLNSIAHRLEYVSFFRRNLNQYWFNAICQTLTNKTFRWELAQSNLSLEFNKHVTSITYFKWWIEHRVIIEHINIQRNTRIPRNSINLSNVSFTCVYVALECYTVKTKLWPFYMMAMNSVSLSLVEN